MQKPDKLSLSIVVPVYNRPQEVKELLQSLAVQQEKNFEIVIVDDGSSTPCKEQVEHYKTKLNITYVYNKKSGPGLTRNCGCRHAKGNYYVVLDSDCMLPPQYVGNLYRALNERYTDVFGGPDKAQEDFSVFQKAINYSMTSFWTTGGIRGGSEKLSKFYPRSFNMGYSKAVFEATGGFSAMPIGEDTDLSIRIHKLGFTSQLIKSVFVFHKRRANLIFFLRQVYIFGTARLIVSRLHPESFSWLYIIPALFTLGVLLLLLLSMVSVYFLTPLVLYAFLLFIEATITTKNLFVGCLSIVTGFAQHMGYGVGFITSFWQQVVRKKK